MGVSPPAHASDSVPEEAAITEEWMGAILGRPGELRSMTRRSIGTGQVGENVRYGLTWSNGGDGPATVVGKFPSLDEMSRETASATGSYVKEVGFYRDLQSTVTLRTPHIHHIGEALDENRFVLIMEDITPAEQGDQLAGCDLERAQLAVDAIAGLHAPHWNTEPWTGLEWMPAPSGQSTTDRLALYNMLFAGFEDRYRDRLAPEVLRFGRWVGTALEEWAAAFRTPLTLVHGDYRLDNMLFATGDGAPPLAVVDWQTTATGRGPADVAYFVGAGLLPDDRRDVERDLVDRYVAGLRSHGVELDDQGADDVLHDYRLGSVTGYVMAVIASQIVGQTERGDEMFCVMAERHAAQGSDLDVAELCPWV